MFDLSNKTAVVSGATGGIGGSVVKLLHAQGAHVCILGRSQEKLDALAAQYSDRMTVMQPVDLSSPDVEDNIKASFKDLLTNVSGIDIIVNNAGVTNDKLAMRMSKSDWDSVVETNLTSQFLVTREAIRYLMRSTCGRIINIASIIGMTGGIGQANYSASKGGLIAMTKSLAKELSKKSITVNSVSPGFIKTSMTDVLEDDYIEQIVEQVPLKRQGDADEVAALVAFLASSEASYITGENINISGGLYI